MAGHSQFKNIMHRKGAQDKKRSKLFSKIIREIVVAAKTGGPDVNNNPRLRAAVQNARAENMPKDKVENAIAKGSGNTDTDNYESIRYEGYGAGGVAIIVEALTDNRNRTASDVRSLFTKYGGNLGETGSVGFMFDHKAVIVYLAAGISEEAALEAALEAGADNCESTSDHHTITCATDQFAEVRDVLVQKFGEPQSSKLAWIPKSLTPVGETHAQQLLKLIDALEDNDDVQEVCANYDIAEDVLEKLSA